MLLSSFPGLEVTDGVLLHMRLETFQVWFCRFVPMHVGHFWDGCETLYLLPYHRQWAFWPLMLPEILFQVTLVV